MKKLLISLTTLFALTGCFGSDPLDPEELAKNGKVLFQSTEITIAIPQDWEVLSQNDLAGNVPSNTIVAFRNNIKNEIFTSNVSIVKSPLTDSSDSKEFSFKTLQVLKNNLIEFQEVGSSELLVNVGENQIETLLLEFRGKQSATNPIINFKQIHIVNGEEAFTFTASYRDGEDETVVKLIDEMLNSFSLN